VVLPGQKLFCALLCLGDRQHARKTKPARKAFRAGFNENGRYSYILSDRMTLIASAGLGPWALGSRT
jgi:hypothetical protein